MKENLQHMCGVCMVFVVYKTLLTLTLHQEVLVNQALPFVGKTA